MQFFSKEMIFLNKEFDSSKDLFSCVALRAKELGYVRDGFLEALEKRESLYPTALPGTTCDIAVPHTDPEFIIKPFIAVVTCQKGVPFIQMGSDNLTIYPKIFFVLGFLREGCELYQVKTLQLLIDFFITKENGQKALEFLSNGEDKCLEELEGLEQQLKK